MPVHDNAGATVANNVIPHGDSYKQFPGLSIYSGALGARCQGAASGRDNDGNVYLFAGDASKLYRISTTTWGDVSVGGGYSCANDSNWNFTQWGEQLLAAQVGDPVQTFTMGTSSTFASLSASAPQARYIGVVRDFVVVGNTYDTSDGSIPFRVRWSAIGDPTDWTVSSTTQSDFQDLNSANGWVQGVVGGEYGIIFQERAITRMTYVGSPAVFQFDEIEAGYGTNAPGSICKIGTMTAYLGEDGFYMFDGTRSTPISHNMVSKTFYSDLDQAYLYRISSVVDPINQVIFWVYPGASNDSGTPNRVIMFNYAQNSQKRWSVADITLEFIARLAIPTSYTLDSLDSVSASLDSLEFSLDSRVWIDNTISLSAFNTDHKLCFFSGTALDATIETGEVEITPGKRTRLSRIRPMVDGGSSVTMQIGTRNALTESVTWSAETAPNATGDVEVRNNARYHRARVKVSGGFTHAQGVDIVEISEGGSR
ncbi:MAG: hypothetical protein WC047_00530 [Kiritimatiellales bacterium]